MLEALGRASRVIPKDCKRLAEVDFPIAEVSKHAAREKSIRPGHPSTLHLWWARRPLASSRAVLIALLWPDPCDPLCPVAFKAEARKRLREVPSCNPGTTDEDLRHALLRFIGDFANWDNGAQRIYLDVSRALVKSAHAPADGAYEPPLVVDPFAGGGSIPLEALRLGCETFASDLNPVACLILKVMLEDIPLHGPKLAEELRRVGAEIKKQAEKELADLYPKDPDGATPIAYRWARTVRCESPNCGAEIPLVRSFWLCKKANRRRALRHRIDRQKGQPPRVEFEIFEPKSEKEVQGGTVTRAKASCVCCGVVLPPVRVRAQLAAQRGGADVAFDAKGRRTGGARMLAVVTLRHGEKGRHYRLPGEGEYEAVREAHARVAQLLAEWKRCGEHGLCPVPDEEISLNELRRISVPIYGMTTWGDLFTSRQKVALVTFARLVRERLTAGDAPESSALALCVNRAADQLSSLVRWLETIEAIASTFGRQAIGMVWDFCETIPTGDQSANFGAALEWVAKVIEGWPASRAGQVQLADAANHPLPDQTTSVWFTDPPYYDAVPYAHLSDYFYVWLRRIFPVTGGTHFGTELAPKEPEIVVDRPHARSSSKKDSVSYEAGMATAFREGRRVLSIDGIGSVVFAHKTTEGWEALLSGMIRGGWTITGSWPIATERTARVNARETASLATSVHLICRPRPDDAGVGEWAEVLRELPGRVGDWMERLQREGVRGADLVFACIGPALEIFSRYTKVETAEGREVKLDEYLAKVWELVGRSALAQVLGTVEARARNGAAGAIEEDARLTALFLWTLQATDGEDDEDAGAADDEDEAADDEEDDEGASRGKSKGFSLVFDVVRRFAQPLGIELPNWEGRVIQTKKGVVRLLPIAERARQLFGEEGASAVAARLEQTAVRGTSPLQGMLFPEMEATPKVRGVRGRGTRASIDVSDESLAGTREATTLDRVHAAMLLQAAGRTNALRALIKAEQDRSPDFLRLANALSALYPKGSEEKRLLDAMLLAVPR
jgi:adenine-specific DNA methylase